MVRLAALSALALLAGSTAAQKPGSPPKGPSGAAPGGPPKPPSGPTPGGPPKPGNKQTRTYDFTIARGTFNPDGASKDGLLVNGQFPGPTIEADVGDEIEVTIHNNIQGPQEGTLLHWHGINQQGTPWYDGTPASQICPVAPGDSFTYRFTADAAGTTWWHSHFSAQHVDGLKGPMIINGPASAEYDIDLGAVFLSDNYQEDYHKVTEGIFGIPPVFAAPQSNLINGKGQLNCTLGQDCPDGTPFETFAFQPGKTHRLRIINAAADGSECFSIDGHNLTVIAADFTPVQPYETNTISLASGQRMDVLVKADGSPDQSYWMRAQQSTAGSQVPGLPVLPLSLAVIRYPQADNSSFPKTTSDPSIAAQCGVYDISTLVPAQASAPPPQPAVTQNIEYTLTQNATNFTLWAQNGVSFRGDYNNPIMLLARNQNTSYPDHPEWAVYNFGSNSSVRLVLQNSTPLPHPMHLHGHQFWVLSAGDGPWDGSSIMNPSNPARRDVIVAPAFGHAVIEFNTDNPGVWPLHCHIAWHNSAGFFLNVMERPDDLAKLPMPPDVNQSLVDRCRNWWTWTGSNTVDQIDSGV